MDVTVLGGTGFLSRAVAVEAVRRGHAVSTVTRGVTGVPAEGVEDLRADREDPAQLAAALDGVRTEAVVDCSGYSVAGARHAAASFPGARTYVYVSSLNAYRHWPPGPVAGEDDPLWAPGEGDEAEYGPMKAASEQVLAHALGDRLLAVRAGLIIGPGDDTGRMTSWLARIAAGGQVVVPDRRDQPVAFVDVRDLAAFLVDAAERGWSGAVNATGPVGMTTFGGLLDACRRVVGGAAGHPARLVAVSEQDLLEEGVQPWRHLPFWLPQEVATTAWQVRTSTARRLGLASRPVQDTLADTWAWMQGTGLVLPAPEDGGPGVPEDLQQRLLRHVRSV